MRTALSTFIASISVAAVFTAGCSGTSQGAPPTLSAASVARTPRDFAGHRGPWMLAKAKSPKSILIYAAPNDSDDVNVYDYATGEQVGMLTDPAAIGGCVDATGNVYMVSAQGTAVEYAHGGTTPLQTYNPGGDLAGCSINAKGDLAITSGSPGAVTVYAGGNPSQSSTYDNASCQTMAAMGYDARGNLIGEGQSASTSICAVLRRAKQESTLTADGITINAPNGAMWDGQYLEVGDQEAGPQKALTGLTQVTVSGTTVTAQGETMLTDPCYRGLVDILNPFVVGKKNTPVNKQQGTVVVGSNRFCTESNSQGIEFWHYPKGGNPFKTYPTSGFVFVLAVSIGAQAS